MDLFIRSTSPLPIGWYGVVRDLVTPNALQSSLRIRLSKFLPWSECSL